MYTGTSEILNFHDIRANARRFEDMPLDHTVQRTASAIVIIALWMIFWGSNMLQVHSYSADQFAILNHPINMDL